MKRPGIDIKYIIKLIIKFILLLIITEVIIFIIIYIIETKTNIFDLGESIYETIQNK